MHISKAWKTTMHHRVAFACLFVSLFVSAACGQCLDYEDYLHPQGRLTYGNESVLVSLCAVGDYVLQVDGWAGHCKVIDCSDPVHPEHVRLLPSYWGLASRVETTGGYAYVSRVYGDPPYEDWAIQIVNVMDPENPIHCGGLECGLWYEEFHVHDSVLVWYDWYNELLKFYDLSTPESPQLASEFYFQFGMQSTEMAGDYLFLCAYDGTFQVFDLSTLSSPALIGYTAIGGGTSFDVSISGDYAYVVCENEKLVIIDISNPHLPEVVNLVLLPGTPYKIVRDGSTLIMVARGGDVITYDITDPLNPTFLGKLQIADSCRSLDVANGWVYLSCGVQGLHTMSLGNPATAEPYATMTEPDRNVRAQASYGDHVYGIADGSGVAVYDLSTVSAPQHVMDLSLPGSEHEVAAGDGHLYATCADPPSFQVMELSDPDNPAVIGACDLTSAGEILLLDDIAYVGSDYGPLQIVDISTPGTPSVIETIETGSDALAVSGDYMVTGSWRYIYIYDIIDPLNPVLVDQSSLPAFNTTVTGIEIQDEYIYVTHRDGYLFVIDMTLPFYPILRAELELPLNSPQDLTIVDHYAYVACEEAGMIVIDLWEPEAPCIIGCLPHPEDRVLSVGPQGDYVIAGGASYGLMVAQPQCPPEAGISAWSGALSSGLAVTPNPFVSGTDIRFQLAAPERARLTVFDLLGREVADLGSARYSAGAHAVHWDGLGAHQHRMSPGLYYIRYESASQTRTANVYFVR